MGFKSKTGQAVGLHTPRDEQLSIFKTVVVQMLKENMTVEQIIAFTEKPSPQTRYGKDNVSELSLAFFGGIDKYTTLEERQQILLEIEETGY